VTDNRHQDKGLRYALERDRTAGMDAESLERQATHPQFNATQQAAARDELIKRHDPSDQRRS